MYFVAATGFFQNKSEFVFGLEFFLLTSHHNFHPIFDVLSFEIENALESQEFSQVSVRNYAFLVDPNWIAHGNF